VALIVRCPADAGPLLLAIHFAENPIPLVTEKTKDERSSNQREITFAFGPAAEM